MVDPHRLFAEALLLGVRCFVGEGSVLEDTVVMGCRHLGSESNIRQRRAPPAPPRMGKGMSHLPAIIDKNTRVGAGCVFVGAGKSDGIYAGGRSSFAMAISLQHSGPPIARRANSLHARPEPIAQGLFYSRTSCRRFDGSIGAAALQFHGAPSDCSGHSGYQQPCRSSGRTRSF